MSARIETGGAAHSLKPSYSLLPERPDDSSTLWFRGVRPKTEQPLERRDNSNPTLQPCDSRDFRAPHHSKLGVDRPSALRHSTIF